MADRSIPHLRDIFGFHGNWGNNNQTRLNNATEMSDQMKGLRIDKDLSTKKDKTQHDRSSIGGNDSAISSIGSASEEELPKITTTKKKKQRSRRENSKTLTEKDVKHLERHLSMKKTIRKKIMRDLQQAFVEDPNEFRVEDISHEQLKAEINVQSLSFGNQNQKGSKKTAHDPSFLDMLRGGSGNNASGGRNANDDGDSGHGSPTRELSSDRAADYEDEEDERDIRKTSFWSRFTIKGRNKR